MSKNCSVKKTCYMPAWNRASSVNLQPLRKPAKIYLSCSCHSWLQRKPTKCVVTWMSRLFFFFFLLFLLIFACGFTFLHIQSYVFLAARTHSFPVIEVPHKRLNHKGKPHNRCFVIQGTRLSCYFDISGYWKAFFFHNWNITYLVDLYLQ